MTNYGQLEHPAAYWVAQNIVLNKNQAGVETDAGGQKRGDGITPWNELLYYTNPQQGGNGSGLFATFGSVNNVREGQTLFIPADYEAVVSLMAVTGILTVDGTLTLL